MYMNAPDLMPRHNSDFSILMCSQVNYDDGAKQAVVFLFVADGRLQCTTRVKRRRVHLVSSCRATFRLEPFVGKNSFSGSAVPQSRRLTGGSSAGWLVESTKQNSLK